MSELYNLFKKESKNYPDMNLFYREPSENKDGSIRYFYDKGNDSIPLDDRGVLTVIFCPNEIEQVFFKREDGKGIGDKVAEFRDNAAYGEIANDIPLPERFREIITRYQFDRDSLGLKTGKVIVSLDENNKATKKVNRDFYGRD